MWRLVAERCSGTFKFLRETPSRGAKARVHGNGANARRDPAKREQQLRRVIMVICSRFKFAVNKQKVWSTQKIQSGCDVCGDCKLEEGRRKVSRLRMTRRASGEHVYARKRFHEIRGTVSTGSFWSGPRHRYRTCLRHSMTPLRWKRPPSSVKRDPGT